MSEQRVIVIGAGVSGLVAALTLARAGSGVDVIEGRQRLGGRIATLHEPDWPLPIELGAEFVHGRPEPSLRWLDAAGLSLRELDDRHHWAITPGAQRDHHTARAALRELPDLWERMSRLLSCVDLKGADMSAAAFAERQRLEGEQRAAFELFVRGFHAAPLGDVSIQTLARDIGGSEDARGGSDGTSEDDTTQYRVDGGHGRLIGWLTQQLGQTGLCRIHLGSILRHVTWRQGQVAIDLEQGAVLRHLAGRALLITLPVGVLSAPKGQGIRFDPELIQKREPLALIGMAQVVKIVLRFRARFWDERIAPRLAFLHAPGATFLTFWREARDAAQQLTAWAGDPHTDLEALRSEASAVELALTTFSERMDVDPAQARACLIAHYHHDFDHDPFACGAYSYLRPGGTGAHAELARPIDGTLFFAGEATDADYPATVAGAIQSGERAAREFLEA